MTDTQNSDKNSERPQNKNLRPWKKGVKQKPGPGRPKTKDFAAEFLAYVSQGNRAEKLFAEMLKKKPDIAMHYLAGKPREMIVIDQTLKAEIATTEIVEQARAIRAEIEKQAQTEQKPGDTPESKDGLH
jgi:hypothetical protein